MKVTFRERMHENQDTPQWDWVLDGDNGEPMARSTESYNDRRDAVICFEYTTGTMLDGSLTASARQIREPIKVAWEPWTHDG